LKRWLITKSKVSSFGVPIDTTLYAETSEAQFVEEDKLEFAIEPKLFGKWTYSDVTVPDMSLESYLQVKTTKQQVYVPYTAGRYQQRRFKKVQCPIIERLTCMVMTSGHRNNGKKQNAVRIIKQTMELIHMLTDKNPMQVLVDAIAVCGPREDSTRIGSGGVVRRQAVDVSPLRRVNIAIYYLCHYAKDAAFRNLKSVSECLADEIIKASQVSTIPKKSNIVAFRPVPVLPLPSESAMRSRESPRVTDEQSNSGMLPLFARL
jgi:small subunit ribosomal protein S5e